MNKIDVIKFLLAEVEEEQIKLLKYQKDWKKAQALADEESQRTGEKYISAWRYFNWIEKKPSKMAITYNLRKIRQLSLKVISDLNREGVGL